MQLACWNVRGFNGPLSRNKLAILCMQHGISIFRFWVTSASFSISLNGFFHGFISNKRGVKQGDPLSPFIFIIAMEFLSCMLKMNTNVPNLKYHPKCERLNLTHLAFADDFIFFLSRGDESSARILMQTLKQFSGFYGLEVNVAKSFLFIAGIPNSEREALQ